MSLDATQDLGAVDLAEHDVPAARSREDVGSPPPVDVEHRQRVEEHVAAVHRRVQPKHRGVERQNSDGSASVMDGIGTPLHRRDPQTHDLLGDELVDP